MTLKSFLDENDRVEGLEPRMSDPKLLYRASRDGWEAKDFHDKCDGKGGTVVVVKSDEGYVFGGYTDVSWTSGLGFRSSSESFLFSLKCHAGLPAVKMGIKAGERYKGGMGECSDW